MNATYSTCEAKAHFSELIRRVRAGERVVITYHGDPVAELRPLEQKPVSLEESLPELERTGVVQRASGRFQGRPLASRPGALARFLEDRE